jgi:transposase-like protein
MEYPEKFKARMVQKLTTPGAPSATALSDEVGVPQPTLSKWVREASRVGGMAKPKRTKVGGRKRPQDWTAEEKLDAVIEAASLREEDLGIFLRRGGLHQTHLRQWRQQIVAGLKAPRSKKTSPEARRLRELERELQRKDKALAETAALLVLKKKAQAIWGDEDDPTTPRSGG